MLKEGIKGERSLVVTEECTARALGSGELPVLATPRMIALVEETAWKSVSEALEEGEGTVGTRIDVKHLAATPMGKTVRCVTELTAVDRKKLTFRAEVFDDAGKVGEGVHERFIVKNGPFLEKAAGRFAD